MVERWQGDGRDGGGKLTGENGCGRAVGAKVTDLIGLVSLDCDGSIVRW